MLSGNVTLDGLMFDNLFLSPLVDGTVRAFTYVCQRIFDVVIMIVVVKGGLFELIGRGHTKNCMVLCELHQYFSFLLL